MELKIDENLMYSFGQEDFEGHHFYALRKVTEFKGKRKYQVLSIKPQHIDGFKSFLKKILTEG